MSRDSSPPAMSDDSAMGSLSSGGAAKDQLNINQHMSKNIHNNRNNSQQPPTSQISRQIDNLNQSKRGRPRNDSNIIKSDDLISAAKQMRRNNVGLISRSIRTYLSCFDELDILKFETNGEFFVNFVSNGIYKCDRDTILRPVSVLWPDSYERIVDKLGILDAFLLNTDFNNKPVEWMLKRGLTSVPKCKLCKDNMTLGYQENSVKWVCQKFQPCSNYYMPIERPSFFNGFESLGLRDLLFAVYFWATCTPGEDLKFQLNIEIKKLNSLWRRIQNVCRIALEKSYPRHRLTDCLDSGNSESSPQEGGAEEKRIPIDLISIKINNIFVVCAKHPSSNLVRVGYLIPNVSQYSFGELTETWFAHGASIRISERKFLSLGKRRIDLKLDLVDRAKIVSKDQRFDRDSAFGYLVTQLTHVFKDYDSSGLPIESLKLMLAELQWRELYGTTPFDAFTNIVNHMAQYGEASDCYSEISAPVSGEETLQQLSSSQSSDVVQYIWAEKYYYATVEPIDRDGNVISRGRESLNFDNLPPPNARVTCHICHRKFECFDFSIHLMHHIETNRKEFERKEYLEKSIIECKHCFKVYPRDHIVIHSTLFRSFLHTIEFGCRICCIKLDDRQTFLQHMRRKHFEHETPYRCPSCRYASSFQRDVFLHFAEEHRNNLIVLCTLCLRSFTVAKPEEMTNAKMRELSKIIYNHIAEHYVLSKNFACHNCNLCFLNKDKLKNHVKFHHNPCEMRPEDEVRLEPFILDREEEKFCVKALLAELFIANKRPNFSLNKSSKKRTMVGGDGDKDVQEGSEKEEEEEDKDSLDSKSSGSTNDNGHKPEASKSDNKNKNNTITEQETNAILFDKAFVNRDEKLNLTQETEELEEDTKDENLIHVRGLSEAKKFLAGPALIMPKSARNQDSCSSQKLIEYLSKMKKADGIIPNQSVILTLGGKPAKCVECLEYITVDHYVSQIQCHTCKYTTLCPRASTMHFKLNHGRDT